MWVGCKHEHKNKGRKEKKTTHFTHASRQGQAWAGTARWVEAGTGLRGWAQAQYRGTQMWAGCKCGYKNKVKKEKLLTRLIVEAGRQGWPQQVWPGMVGCESAGAGHRQAGGCRAGHRDRQVCAGWQA